MTARTHFLHIGKTAGSAIKDAILMHEKSINTKIIFHPHKTRLLDIKEGENVFFFLRDPLERFVSGFNSRLRQGKPKYNIPWSEKEAAIFSKFSSAEELALALIAKNPFKRYQAKKACESIKHIRNSYKRILGGTDYLEKRAKDILFIGFVETIEVDMNNLALTLGSGGMKLSSDSRTAHRAPVGEKKNLSPKAIYALQSHLKEEINLYQWVKVNRVNNRLRLN